MAKKNKAPRSEHKANPSGLISYGMTPDTPFESYLACDSVINAEHDSVRSLFTQIAPQGSVHEKAEQLYRWVRDEITHSVDAGSTVVTCRASEVAEERTGLCCAKAHLLVALLRLAGIPSGFGYQRLRSNPGVHEFELHGFAFFLSDEHECFVPLDPRGNNNRVNTVFAPPKGSLAFKPKVGLGESTLPTVFAEPSPKVVQWLLESSTLKVALSALPSMI